MSTPVQRDVRREMTFRLLPPDGTPPVDVDVDVSWTPADPYAVTLGFVTGRAGVVRTWLLGRDLLADGMIDAAGEGDVRVWPAADNPERVYLRVMSPSGAATFSVAVDDLCGFLTATWAVVPEGSESGLVAFPDTPDELDAAAARPPI